MCPMCISTAAMMVAGSATGGGLIGFVAFKWRALRARHRQR